MDSVNGSAFGSGWHDFGDLASLLPTQVVGGRVRIACVSSRVVRWHVRFSLQAMLCWRIPGNPNNSIPIGDCADGCVVYCTRAFAATMGHQSHAPRHANNLVSLKRQAQSTCALLMHIPNERSCS